MVLDKKTKVNSTTVSTRTNNQSFMVSAGNGGVSLLETGEAASERQSDREYAMVSARRQQATNHARGRRGRRGRVSTGGDEDEAGSMSGEGAEVDGALSSDSNVWQNYSNRCSQLGKS